jgi:hypothetical protein
MKVYRFERTINLPIAINQAWSFAIFDYRKRALYRMFGEGSADTMQPPPMPPQLD